jgi:type II/III secretion system protein
MRSRTVTRAFKIMTAALAVLTTATLVAQDAQPAAPSRPGSPVSLKLSLVFSRYQGEKKISSVPHTLWATATDGRTPTTLRLGTQIPVPTTIFGKEGEKTQSYNYRDVGTNIDVNASNAQDGFYKIQITITDSSVYYPDQSETAARTVASTGAPAFRNFNSSFTLMMKDGQTAQSTAVTDPVSGQTIKLDATLNVQK